MKKNKDELDKKIDDFLKQLRKEDYRFQEGRFDSDPSKGHRISDIFDLICKKCESNNVLTASKKTDENDPYGTGIKFVVLIKCLDCGNAYCIEESDYLSDNRCEHC